MTKIKCNRCNLVIQSNSGYNKCYCGNVFLQGDHIIYKETADITDLTNESVIVLETDKKDAEIKELKRHLEILLSRLNGLMKTVEHVPCSCCTAKVGQDWYIEQGEFYCIDCYNQL